MPCFYSYFIITLHEEDEMKKALLLVSILFVSVVSTACINNFAVQELNTKAKSYLDEGNYEEAIERLKSSIDLDDTIFETHYNLAVAYTQAEDYANAIDAYKQAILLNPDFADAYYSLAVTQSNLASDLKNGNVRLDENGKYFIPELDDLEDEKNYIPSKEILENIKSVYSDAKSNYELYLEKSPDAEDKDDIQEEINKISKLLK